MVISLQICNILPLKKYDIILPLKNEGKMENWKTLPFDEFKLCLRLEDDKFGLAEAAVNAAIEKNCDRVGRRVLRLHNAINCGNIETICRTIASIYNSALKDQKTGRFNAKFLKICDRSDILGDLLINISYMSHKDKLINFIEFFEKNYFLFCFEDWEFYAQELKISWNIVKKVSSNTINKLSLTYNTSLDGRQLCWDLAS